MRVSEARGQRAEAEAGGAQARVGFAHDVVLGVEAAEVLRERERRNRKRNGARVSLRR